MKKELLPIIIVMMISLYIAYAWESLPFVKNFVNSALNPTIGALLEWHLTIGFIIVIAITSLILTLSQKYLSDQEELKEIRKEQ